MFRWFIGAEAKLKVATAGIEKYVAKFEAAAQAAEKELAGVEPALQKKLGKFDRTMARADVVMDKVFAVHQSIQNTLTSKSVEAGRNAENRKDELAKIAATARKAVDNHKAIYLS